MCRFFSFVTARGVPRHLSPAQIRASRDPDSHSQIAQTLGLNIDRVNSYEFSPPHAGNILDFKTWRFNIDTLRGGDDSTAARKWMRTFAETPEFKLIIAASIKRNPGLGIMRPNPTIADIMRAASNYGIKTVAPLLAKRKLTAEVRAKLLRNHGGAAFSILPNITNAEIDATVKRDPSNIKFMKDPTLAQMVMAVRSRPWGIIHVPKALRIANMTALIDANPNGINYLPQKQQKLAVECSAKAFPALERQYQTHTLALLHMKLWTKPVVRQMTMAQIDAMASAAANKPVKVWVIG